MTSTQKWAARAAAVVLSATVLTGMSASPTEAAASASTAHASAATTTATAAKDCSVGPGRPDGTITRLLEPLIGSPYGLPGSQPLGLLPFVVTGLLDRIVDPLLCRATP